MPDYGAMQFIIIGVDESCDIYQYPTSEYDSYDQEAAKKIIEESEDQMYLIRGYGMATYIHN